VPKIIGSRFKQARESLNLSIEDLVKKTTYSKLQLHQIEEGGHSAFYTLAIQLQCAKKVADILGLSHEEAFEATQSEMLTGVDSDLSLNTSKIHADAINADCNWWSYVNRRASHPCPSSITRKPKTSAKTWPLWSIAVAMIVAVMCAAVPPILEAKRPGLVAEESSGPPPPVEQADPMDELATAQPAERQSLEQPQGSSAPQKNTTLSCQLPESPNLSIAEYIPSKASKPGNQIYVLNKGVAQTICFEDVTGKLRELTVLPNEGFSFFGRPPFKIVSKTLNQFEIYYQGFRVRPELLGQAISLSELKID
jgi:transcriptional regulator with XRE-family HTH domain